MRSIYILILILLFLSCSDKPKQHKDGSEVGLEYAKLLKVYDENGLKQIDILDPWNDGKILHSYDIRKPFHRIIVFTAAHAYLLNKLGAKDCIAGVCDKQYIVSDFANDLPDCGNSMNPDIEKIISLKPDAIIVSPFQNSGGYGALEKLGVPIIEAADYMETLPLARAEWMRFYGQLVGKEEKAKSLFKKVEKSYRLMSIANVKLRSSKAINNSSPFPLVMTDLQVASAWYVPGGQSTTAHLIADAGGRYAFADNKESGSFPVSFETMLQKNGNADIWMIKYNADAELSLSKMRQDKEGYAQFKAFQTQQVYGCNTAKSPFFEVAPFFPNIILKEYRNIIQGNEDSLMYFKRLKQ